MKIDHKGLDKAAAIAAEQISLATFRIAHIRADNAMMGDHAGRISEEWIAENLVDLRQNLSVALERLKKARALMHQIENHLNAGIPF